MADSRLLTPRARSSKKSPTSSMAKLLQAAACVLVFMAATSSAYVPASPTNETSSLVAADDFIQINWLPMGTSAYKDALSRQLANTAQVPVAGYRGALVHFVEANATSGTGAPWIALINCDDSTGTPSGSGATLQVDSVTLAMRAGAETAILYSLEAETCVLDRSFVAGNNGTLDLYVTASQASARSIIQQFMNTSPETYWYNGTALEASQSNIESQISSMGGVPTTATEPSLFGPSGSTSTSGAAPTQVPNGDGITFNYLIATVANSGNSTNGSQITTQPQNNQGGGGANTGLAMIILYAITGCVTLLFLVVIMSGAIRAMRHPERYGPRARTSRNGDNGQSRIGGLSQAILDTFPVVKFLSGQKQAQTRRQSVEGASTEGADDDGIKDIETGTIEDIESRNSRRGDGEMMSAGVPMQVLGASRHSTSAPDSEIAEDTPVPAIGIAAAAEGSQRPRSAEVDETAGGEEQGTSADHAHEHGDEDEQVDTSVTCPICLLDFEDGDDLRVLPCDSRHQFHDACVVPWLLNVSSLCPLCRLDLAKDREASGAEAGTTEEAVPERPATRPRASSVLATSFRQLLPTTGSSNRASRQAAPSTGDSTIPEAGPSGVGELGHIHTDDPQQGATRSRWMRYVQQRRQRVLARTTTRRDPPSAPPATER